MMIFLAAAALFALRLNGIASDMTVSNIRRSRSILNGLIRLDLGSSSS